MNKYIDAERLKVEIESIINSDDPVEYNLMEKQAYNRALSDAIDLITSLRQEQPKLTQVPRIEQETKKKGWMDYGLLIIEIGLHRSNAIDRIKETKERAAEIKKNIAPHDLAILGKYLESVGAEIVLCCLQQYCMDCMFTQDEVKEIIQQEQPDVDLEKEIISICETYGITKYLDAELGPLDIKNIAHHFYELGLNARKEE